MMKACWDNFFSIWINQSENSLSINGFIWFSQLYFFIILFKSMSEASNNISKLHKYYPATISSIWSRVKGTQWGGLFIFYISYGIFNDNMFLWQVGGCSGARITIISRWRSQEGFPKASFHSINSLWSWWMTLCHASWTQYTLKNYHNSMC